MYVYLSLSPYLSLFLSYDLLRDSLVCLFTRFASTCLVVVVAVVVRVAVAVGAVQHNTIEQHNTVQHPSWQFQAILMF